MMTKSAACTPVRCASILLVLLLLLSAVPFRALASETSDNNIATYILTGEFEGQFDLSSEKYTLFHLEDLIPGDYYTGSIEIKNKAAGDMAVSLLTITSDISDMVLFDALDLEISHDGYTIYSGSYNTDLDPITEHFRVSKGKTLVFDYKVGLPLKATNEVQGRIMDSTWTFEALYAEEPQTGHDLTTENTLNLYVLWIILFALLAAAIVALRIRFVMKAQKEEPKEVNKK